MKRRRTKRVDRRAGFVWITTPRPKKAAPKTAPKKIAAAKNPRRATKPRAEKKAASTKGVTIARKGAAPQKSAKGKKPTAPKPATAKRAAGAAKRKAAPKIEGRRLQAALFAIREGTSAAAAAREVGISPRTLTSYLERTGIAKLKGERWEISKSAPREWTFPSLGKWVTATVSAKRSKGMSAFLNHVHWFSESNNTNDIAFFKEMGVTDIHGKRHPFETRPDVLRELLNTADPYEQIYRIVAPQ